MTDDRASLNPQAITPELPDVVAPAPAPVAAPAQAPVAAGEPNLVGQNLDGRYQVLKRLGEGELSVAYEARHSSSGRHFAVKVLRASFAGKQGLLDKYLQYARAAAQIRNDNVVAIEEFGYTPTGSVYAAVELVVGETLEAMLARDGRWSWAQARPVILQIATALDAAHRAGVVHRALKPSNCFVILDPRGKREPFVKVADFGMAQVGMEASQAGAGTAVAALFGNPEYMAPEQGLGGQIGPTTDIYALGVVLYRMLTGRVPFSNANAFQVISHHANKPVPPPREIELQVPEAVEQIILRCMGKTPEQRYGAAAEVKQALEAVPSGAQGGVGGAGVPSNQPASNSGPRFAKMNAGGAPGQPPAAAPPPAKQPSVIVAGSIGDDGGAPGGGISGTIGGSTPSFHDAPPPSSEMTSSFLASRPGLRMGLGASLPTPAGADEPAPPPTVAPGMAVPTPTMFPGINAPFASSSDSGPPELPQNPAAGMPAPVGGYQSSSDPSLPPPVGGGYMPPSGPGAGMPPSDGGYTPPSGPGPGMPGGGGGYTPPSGPGPGMPGGGGYTPPSGPGPGMPGGGGGYTPPSGPGPGMPGGGGGYTPPSGPGPGMPGGGGYTPPSGPGPGMPGGGGGYTPPSGPGPGMPGGGGGYTPPSGPGPGMPGGGYTPPSGPGPGMPGMPRDNHGSPDGLARGVGPGMPPRDPSGVPGGGGVGPGMPMRRGVGPGMPPAVDSGPNAVVRSSMSQPGVPSTESPTGLGAVEYDEDDAPKKRPLLIVGIAVGVILAGAGLGWLIIGGDDGPEGDLAKVTRTGKAQDIDVTPEEEPEQEKPEDDEPEVVVKTKNKTKPKPSLTFQQSLNQLKGRIRGKCKKLGPGPISIDLFVSKDGGGALTPKVKPKGPVGACALRLVERWTFPASEQDHPVNESISW